MTRVEKNALGKVNTVLRIALIGINSALMILMRYAPTQEQLVTVLNYIVDLLQSIVDARPLPGVPDVLTTRSTEERNIFIGGEFADEPLLIEPEFNEVSEAINLVETPVFEVGSDSFRDAASGEIAVHRNDKARFIDADPNCPRTV